MLKELLTFLNEIKNNNDSFFIEAEAKLSKMDNFINNYNAESPALIDVNSDGIIVLQEDANKYGLELRLYVPIEPPREISHLFKKTSGYRAEYPYRLNNNCIISELFKSGCKIGKN